MTDPLRRDPTEFLRTLKRMTANSSWHKGLLFASRGRMIGFKLGIQHYNALLFSQCLWGRALEIVRVARAMNEDGVQPNGISYYYICNGMANADHGMNAGYNLNFKLERLQHWRVATEALLACEANGYDPADTMYNSAIVTCTIPVMNQWRHAAALFRKLVADERNPHPQMIEFFVQCLIRNRRPREAAALLRFADESGVKGYEGKGVPDVFAGLPGWDAAQHDAADRARDDDGVDAGRHHRRRAAGNIPAAALLSSGHAGDADDAELRAAAVDAETVRELAAEEELEALTPRTGGFHADEGREFRPRVYRGMWHKWNAVANRYRPAATLHRRQIAPRNSPTGIPGFSRT